MQYESLDPFVLGNRIQHRLRKIEKMKKTKELATVEEPGSPDCRHPLITPELEGPH